MQKKPPPWYSTAAVRPFRLLLFHRHVLALSESKQISLRLALAENGERSPELRVLWYFSPFLGRIPESDASDTRSEETVDFSTPGIEGQLVDLHSLSHEPAVELVAPRPGDHEAGLHLVLMLDRVVDKSCLYCLGFGCKQVEKLLLTGSERVGLYDHIRRDSATAVDNSPAVRLELRT